MRQNAYGITLASTSHTIVSLNNRRIFATRSSQNSITSGIIPRRLKTCSVLFFDFYVELFMRGYIANGAAQYNCAQVSPPTIHRRYDLLHVVNKRVIAWAYFQDGGR